VHRVTDLTAEVAGTIGEEQAAKGNTIPIDDLLIGSFRHRARLCGCYDRNGTQVIPLEFHSALQFSEGLAPVIHPDGTAGYIDHSGSLQIRLQPSRPWRFVAGLAAVTYGDRVEYIDRSGRRVAFHTTK
jgi:hypothetical protein